MLWTAEAAKMINEVQSAVRFRPFTAYGVMHSKLRLATRNPILRFSRWKTLISTTLSPKQSKVKAKVPILSPKTLFVVARYSLF